MLEIILATVAAQARVVSGFALDPRFNVLRPLSMTFETKRESRDYSYRTLDCLRSGPQLLGGNHGAEVGPMINLGP